MTAFTTRIELHDNATWDEYARLHAEMAKRGFTRTIIGSDGVEYELPGAEYDLEANVTSMDVIEAAKAAASAAAPTNRRAILVSEAVNRVWNGLNVA